MMISKSLICTGMLVLLAMLEGVRTSDPSLVFQAIFFSLLLVELQCIKTMIKNIPPWY